MKIANKKLNMGLRIWIVATSVMLFSVNVLSQEYETTTTQPLLAGEKVEWKDLKLQVVKVEENSVSTDLDNSAVLFFQLGKRYYEHAMKSYEFKSVGNYEVYARTVKSGTLQMPSHVVLRLRYIPPKAEREFFVDRAPPKSGLEPVRRPAGIAQKKTRSTRKTLSVGEDLSFGSIMIRLIRINPNDAGNTRDDTATFVIRTPYSSFTTTLGKYHSKFTEDCEIYVEDLKVSGTRGGGRCTVKITCGG